MKDEEEITVIFTGGKDSTLTAALMCQQFKKVHLITYIHSLSKNPANSLVNVRKLEDIFGKNKIEHKFLPIDELARKIYTDSYFKNLKKYKTYLAGCFCLACRLAMNTRAIIYNLDNDIKFACDGSNRTSFGMSQTEWIIKEVKKFYKDCGVEFSTPIYDVQRSDLELFKLGISFENQHILYGSKNTQGSCYGSNFHSFYLRLYYLPLYGREAHEIMSRNYFNDKLRFCKNYIHNYICLK